MATSYCFGRWLAESEGFEDEVYPGAYEAKYRVDYEADDVEYGADR